jgi:predicted enzyme related to lactoylglutathione lyase
MAQGVAAVWVPVEDMGRAVEFYSQKLGFALGKQGADWSEVDANGLLIGLNAREGTSAASSGGAVISFQPEGSIDDEVATLTGKGVTFTGAISDHDWGRIAPFKDSEGNDLQIYAPPA